MDLPQNNEMRWEIKRFERSETGEDIRREGGKTIGTKTEENQEKGVERGDNTRLVKEMRPSNTPLPRDLIEL